MRNMVVVISDLHFEEEKEDILKFKDPEGEDVGLKRNVPSAFFEALICDVVDLATQQGVKKLDFVLAGDVFDLHRTQLWFREGFSDVRPFVDNGKVASGSALEAAILRILDRIVEEEEVQHSLEAFQRLAQGLVRGDNKNDIKIAIPEISMHYLPGNHDRLVNATPALRRRVRGLLKLGDDDSPFQHNFRFSDPNVFIRHGHEYDSTNFGGKLRKQGKHIAQDQPSEFYDKATFGDFVTVQVASRLPNLFRSHYGDDEIARDDILRTIYLRLLEFDDLRPHQAVVRFILDIRPPVKLKPEFRGHPEIWQARMWRKVEPVMCKLLDDVWASASGNPDARAVVPWWMRALLWTRVWRLGIGLWAMQFLGVVLGLLDRGAEPQLRAQHEQAVHDNEGADFVAAGHTHAPQVAHLFMDKAERKKYFVDTGTWRNAVLGSAKRRQFGRVNATTYVAFFGQIGTGEKVNRSFEFRTGLLQDWPVDSTDR